MTRPVVWSRDALADLADQVAHLAVRNPPAARRVARALDESARKLGEIPTGRPGRVRGTYEKSVPGLPYIIAYALTGSEGQESVAILRVIHTARDWPEGSWPD